VGSPIVDARFLQTFFFFKGIAGIIHVIGRVVYAIGGFFGGFKGGTLLGSVENSSVCAYRYRNQGTRMHT
jgi:hypothetical protein